MSEVRIKLSPYDSLAILKFLREFINEETQKRKGFEAINNAVNNYEAQVTNNITIEQLEDCEAESAVNYLLGKHPDKNNTDTNL